MEPNRPNIFLVENAEMHSLWLDQQLKEKFLRHRLHIFRSGEACLEGLKRTTPDIIILDYLLPGIDGLQTLQTIKSQHKDVSVVVLSLQQNQEVTRQMIKAGADDYVVKGGESFDRLLTTMQTIVSEKEGKAKEYNFQITFNKPKWIKGILLFLFIVLLGVLLGEMVMM